MAGGCGEADFEQLAAGGGVEPDNQTGPGHARRGWARPGRRHTRSRTGCKMNQAASARLRGQARTSGPPRPNTGTTTRRERWARLRRSLWQPPRAHGEQPRERVVGPLELFYDLPVPAARPHLRRGGGGVRRRRRRAVGATGPRPRAGSAAQHPLGVRRRAPPSQRSRPTHRVTLPAHPGRAFRPHLPRVTPRQSWPGGPLMAERS